MAATTTTTTTSVFYFSKSFAAPTADDAGRRSKPLHYRLCLRQTAGDGDGAPPCHHMHRLVVVDAHEMAWVRRVLTSQLVIGLQREIVLSHLQGALVESVSAHVADTDASGDLPDLPSTDQNIYFSKNFRGDAVVPDRAKVRDVYFRVRVRRGHVQLCIIDTHEKEAVLRVVRSPVVQTEAKILAGIDDARTEDASRVRAVRGRRGRDGDGAGAGAADNAGRGQRRRRAPLPPPRSSLKLQVRFNEDDNETRYYTK